MEDELLPQVDEKGMVIGSNTREAFHKNPKIIHPVIQCWIFNSKGQILWQRRSFKKETSPGMWDISCGGHIRFGESVKTALKRELAEELGIHNSKPVFVETYIARQEQQTEFVYLCYIVLDCNITDFVLQEEEVIQVQWIDVWKAQLQYISKEVEATDFVISGVSRILQFLAAKQFT